MRLTPPEAMTGNCELAVVIETVGNVAGEQVVVDTDDVVRRRQRHDREGGQYPPQHLPHRIAAPADQRADTHQRDGRKRDRPGGVGDRGRNQRHGGSGAPAHRVGRGFDHRAPAQVGDIRALGRTGGAAGGEDDGGLACLDRVADLDPGQIFDVDAVLRGRTLRQFLDEGGLEPPEIAATTSTRERGSSAVSSAARSRSISSARRLGRVATSPRSSSSVCHMPTACS